MNYVEPIRNKEKLKDILEYLKDRKERDFILFMLGIHSGLRISDILQLKVKDVKGRKSIRLVEKKTGKTRLFPINPELDKVLQSYCKEKKKDEYLIKSREGINSPITRVRAYQIISDVAEDFSIENIGTHSMRKTFGYHYYKKTKDIVTLQKIFNHSYPSETLRYIGIEQQNINEAMKSMRFL